MSNQVLENENAKAFYGFVLACLEANRMRINYSNHKNAFVTKFGNTDAADYKISISEVREFLIQRAGIHDWFIQKVAKVFADFSNSSGVPKITDRTALDFARDIKLVNKINKHNDRDSDKIVAELGFVTLAVVELLTKDFDGANLVKMRGLDLIREVKDADLKFYNANAEYNLAVKNLEAAKKDAQEANGLVAKARGKIPAEVTKYEIPGVVSLEKAIGKAYGWPLFDVFNKGRAELRQAAQKAAAEYNVAKNTAAIQDRAFQDLFSKTVPRDRDTDLIGGNYRVAAQKRDVAYSALPRYLNTAHQDSKADPALNQMVESLDRGVTSYFEAAASAEPNKNIMLRGNKADAVIMALRTLSSKEDGISEEQHKATKVVFNTLIGAEVDPNLRLSAYTLEAFLKTENFPPYFADKMLNMHALFSAPEPDKSKVILGAAAVDAFCAIVNKLEEVGISTKSYYFSVDRNEVFTREEIDLLLHDVSGKEKDGVAAVKNYVYGVFDAMASKQDEINKDKAKVAETFRA
jgi:hypothetical protein